MNSNLMNKLYNMKALKIVTIIYIVFLYGITSYAQITLSEIFNPSLQESDGWIEITAAGSAQPFFINLYLTGSNTPIASSDDVFITGNYRFEELAAGEYTVIVYDREGCETIIAPIILEDEPRCDIDYYVNTLKHATSIDYREQTSIDDGEIESMKGMMLEGESYNKQTKKKSYFKTKDIKEQKVTINNAEYTQVGLME